MSERVNMNCPRCGSVLSAVTWTCVRGDKCREGGFAANIQSRLTIINQMIPNANKTERRKLQKERSDLERTLSKASR